MNHISTHCIEDLLKLSNARIDRYKELLTETKEGFSKTIIFRLINQSLRHIDDFANENPELYPILNQENKYLKILENVVPNKGCNLTQPEVFGYCSEIEKTVIECYKETLSYDLPLPISMIATQQLKEINQGYEKILFLKDVQY